MPSRNSMSEFDTFMRFAMCVPKIEPLASKSETKSFYLPKIKKVIFNSPATIIFWQDDTKTVVKAVNEPYDPEKGLAMAISKKAFGNNQSYYSIFEKNLKKLN